MIVIDLDLCQEHAVCQSEAPEIFVVPKRGKVEMLKQPHSNEQIEAARRAVRYCPTRAIRWIEDEGEK
ncbi:MAG: ferredoxin [Actinomycetota bacterium]